MSKVRTLNLRPIIGKEEVNEHKFKTFVRWFGYFLFILIVFGIIKLVWFR